MCGFPSLSSKPPAKKAPKHKKSGLRLNTSTGSHISIASLPGSLTINTGALPGPKPESKLAPPQPTFPPFTTYTQTTTFTSPFSPSGPTYPSYGSTSQYIPSCLDPYQQPAPVGIRSKTEREERERRRSSLLREISFVQSLSEKLNPKKIEGPKPELQSAKQSETEKTLLEEIGALRNEWREKERKDAFSATVAAARAEGLREGRQALDRREEGYNGGHRSRGCESHRAASDVATTFLASVGMEALRDSTRRRSRSRSRSRDRHRTRDGSRDCSQPIYIIERGRGRKSSLEAVYAGLGKITDDMRQVKGRLVDADFDRYAQRLRDVSYAKRY